MKLLTSIIACTFLASGLANAQKYVAESSTVSFFSDASLEDIKAENTKTVSLFNSETGDIAFSIPVNQFQFEKSLMQEHFNEKYLESDKYPKATFQGKLSEYSGTNTTLQNVNVTGKLTIHGVAKEVTIPGTVEKVDQKLLMKATFIIRLEDYKVKIPQLMWQNIAEQVEVSVTFTYKPQ